MRLSIMICTIPERAVKLNRLLELLKRQNVPDVEILINNDVGITIGEKRNILASRASGEYGCFVDDDDMISEEYINRILTAIKNKPDCVGLCGIIYFNGSYPRMFYHTIESAGWYTSGNEYWRTPNHLNPIRLDIMRRVGFENCSFGEDQEYSKAVRCFLKTEETIEAPIYYYLYRIKTGENM